MEAIIGQKQPFIGQKLSDLLINPQKLFDTKISDLLKLEQYIIPQIQIKV